MRNKGVAVWSRIGSIALGVRVGFYGLFHSRNEVTRLLPLVRHQDLGGCSKPQAIGHRTVFSNPIATAPADHFVAGVALLACPLENNPRVHSEMPTPSKGACCKNVDQGLVAMHGRVGQESSGMTRRRAPVGVANGRAVCGSGYGLVDGLAGSQA